MIDASTKGAVLLALAAYLGMKRLAKFWGLSETGAVTGVSRLGPVRASQGFLDRLTQVSTMDQGQGDRACLKVAINWRATSREIARRSWSSEVDW
jgi:hypothetical protein